MDPVLRARQVHTLGYGLMRVKRLAIAWYYHSWMVLVVVLFPRLRRPEDSTLALTTCPPAPPPPHTHIQEPADSEPKSAKLTVDQLQFEANQLKLALATR